MLKQSIVKKSLYYQDLCGFFCVCFNDYIINKFQEFFSPSFSVQCYGFSHHLLSWKVNDGSECIPIVCAVIFRTSWEPQQVCLISIIAITIFVKWLWSSTDFLVEKDNNYCVCETPCNMTRYGKELSMVKIPSKASAKYLAKKFNKTEQYIG